MLRTLILTPFLLLLAAFTLHAQTYTIKGRLIDGTDKSSLIAADVQLINTADTTKRQGQSTDTSGRFTFSGLAKGTYVLKFIYLGYKTQAIKLTTTQPTIDLGSIKLSSGGIQLPEAEVEGHQIRAEQKGDTVQYHADAFKVNPDATTEDLVTKMPGIVVTNGSVQAHGETVQQVLVDGKPFFGDDPTAALRNLPAEVVDKVQVYDQMSDLSKFTGFDDGNTQKTMNIITKKDKRKGDFGKFTAGYGFGTNPDGKSLNSNEGKYLGSGNLNIFNGDERISILGLTNNINQQNFSSQDLLGVMGSSGQRGGGGGGRGGAALIGNMGYNGGASSNFLVGQQGGINNTNSWGLNFSDSLAHKIYFTASYFGNKIINTTNSNLTRTFFTPQQYIEQDNSTSPNLNNRINLRFDYAIDTNNSILFTPKISTQANMLSSTDTGKTTRTLEGVTSPQNNTGNNYYNSSTGYNLNANLLFRHKFRKTGRTFSWNVGAVVTNKNSIDTLHSLSHYRTRADSIGLALDSTVRLNQQTTSPSPTYNFSSNLAYTEPIGKTGQLQINYTPSYSVNNLNKITDTGNSEYHLDTVLSNKYTYTTFTNKAGISFRTRGKNSFLMVGLNAQNENLKGDETYPSSFSGTKAFNSLLPTLMYNYKFNASSNLRLFYTTNTQVPSITQLQNVINNTNPLALSTGNPNLNQSYNNNIIARYAYTNTKTAQSIFFFASVSNTFNYIGNATFTGKDSSLSSEYNKFLHPGTQFTLPENMNGDWSARAFVTYGLPMDKIKSNLNINGGVTYSSTPGIVGINNVDKVNFSNTYNFNPGFVLSSNISPKIDYTLSYSPSYNIVKNTVEPQANSNYFSQTATFKFNWIFYKGFTFNNELDHTLYSGLANYNQNFFIWNISVGKKFLKNQAGELKLYVFDLLGENKSISRTITATYIDDMNTQVLTRYVMLSFTYTLRKFSGMVMPSPNQEQDRRRFFRPPGGGPPPGGGDGGGDGGH